MSIYYNEIDTYLAQWLRNLIKAGHIAPGDVDHRSIEDIKPDDLKEYKQCHFFAGIGIWSHCLRAAGWEDSRSVWTASCPCQPFSEAGKGVGFADKRHLWPHLFYLIGELMPTAILGEQVASAAANVWCDLVQDDLEALGYAFAAVPFPAGGAGSFHIRDRTYWCANSNKHNSGRQATATNNQGAQANRPANWSGRYCRSFDVSGHGEIWLPCADGKSRPIEPGLCPVVDEYPTRVAQLRAFGNSLDARAATAFISAAMAYMP